MEPNSIAVMSLGEVVAFYKSRPQKSAAEYMAEISKIAQYYGAGILREPEGPAVLVTKSEVFRRCWDSEVIITEEAEVLSIETVKKL